MRRDRRNRIIVACNLLAIFFMVYVIASSAGYTVILGDDFTHGVRVGAFHVPFFQYVMASLSYMKEIYLDWQGTYFAMFLQAFLSPINNFGLVQLKVVMIANALLFFLSLFGTLWATFMLAGKCEKEMHTCLTVYTIVLFCILDADVFTEIFFWYSGAVAYSFPFSVMFLGIMCFLLSNNNCYENGKRRIFTVLSAILLFLSGGGSLTVSGTGCYVVVLLTLGIYLVRREISVSNITITAMGIAGAVVNTAAPGNFSRHTYSSGGEHSWRLVQSVKWAVKNVWSEMERLTKETMFGVMILVMLILGIFLYGRLQSVLKIYGVISVLGLVCGYVTAFPVAFGYSGSEFPNRCRFILDVVLVISLLNFAVFAGCCLEQCAGLRANKSACAILSVLLFMTFLLSPERVSDSALFAVVESKHNGSYENYYEKCKALYEYLENCPEQDVVLEMPEYIENFECFYFDEDENGWVNVAIAQYYDKNSVKRK